MKNEKEGVSDLVIEQLSLGEYPGNEAEILLADPAVRRRVEALNASNEEILEALPPELMTAEIQARAEAPARGARILSFTARSLRWLPAAAALAVLIGFAFFQGLIPGLSDSAALNNTARDTGSGVRMKGAAPELRVYHQTRRGDVIRLQDGDVAAPGDRIQLAYQAAGARYGVILSVDGRGTVTAHYPGSAQGVSPALEAGGEVPLSFSYLLDDAPRYEKFIFAAAPEAFNIPPLEESLKKTGEINTRLLPRGYTLRIVTIKKEAP